MPHQCTSCGHAFADGSKEMLSGCPDCGGTKFQFRPEGAEIPDDPGDAEPPDRPTEDSVAGTVGSAAATVKNLVGGSGRSDPPEEERVAGVALEESSPESDTEPSATESPAETPTTGPSPETPTGTPSPDTPDPGPSPDSPGSTPDRSSVDASTADTEDAAQASARTDVVSPDELPDTDATSPPVEGGTVVDEPDEDHPDLSELREELNAQFESIKVLEPGQYELNLMELYDREEYIIALQEDGKYSIQVPDTWQE